MDWVRSTSLARNLDLIRLATYIVTVLGLVGGALRLAPDHLSISPDPRARQFDRGATRGQPKSRARMRFRGI